jgi:hypothetical protein
MLSDRQLAELAHQLAAVPGVAGVALGGSRARGDAHPDSDVDLGLYYRPPLDVAGLRALARAVAGPEAELTDPGAWGPEVDGGGWLRLDGVAVDWLYRDLDRVHRSWAAAREGRLEFAFQVGHPFGVPSTWYAGEIATAVLLADPTGELTELHRTAQAYPPALAEAFVARLAEADFLLSAVVKAASRGDTAYVAGVLFRVVELCAYALHGRAGRWLLNEKGAVAAAGRLPFAPPDFAERAPAVLAALGRKPAELLAAVTAAQQLVAAVRAVV